jgi:hypothetical protein
VTGPDPTTFLSGESGEVSGRRLPAIRRIADLRLDAAAWLRRSARTLDRLAAEEPPRRVLALSVYRPGSLLPAALGPLRSERHDVRLAFGATGEPDPALAEHTVAQHLRGGKFQNLNQVEKIVRTRPSRVLRTSEAAAPMLEYDWLLVVDDDVALPERFLDRFLGVCGHFGFDLAQPAQTLRSHAAWRVARRHPRSLARETRFVEIGPVTAFRAPVAADLLPFPELRFGWGLDLHWAALAAERGWRPGVVDALPVDHSAAPVAAGYGHAEAIEEARLFLADRPYLPSEQAQATVAVHRRP